MTSDDAELVKAYLIECGVRKDLIKPILDDMTTVELRLRAREIAREKNTTEPETAVEEWMSTRRSTIKKGRAPNPRILSARSNMMRAPRSCRPRGRPRKHPA